ncbi:MAG: hypothetical protein HOP29_11145 [Phycisphaerales bacterium]|nr:hypothetical protein [Phycisphaerales bacterium]
MSVYRIGIAIGFIAGAWAGTATPAWAAPAILTHQGVIQINGERFNGRGAFRFVFVDEDTGSYLWVNDGSAVASPNPPINAVSLPVVNGVYQVFLGDDAQPGMTQLPPSLFQANADVVLRVWFDDLHGNGIHRLVPDLRITTAPYARRTEAADRLNIPGTADPAVFVDDAGRVGIGTTDPGEPLEVSGRIRADEMIVADGTATDTLAVVGDAAFGGNVGIGDTTPGRRLSVNGSVSVDSSGSNTGVSTPGLLLGGDAGGEAIASKRTSGGNQFGLDFYSNFEPRLSITNAGNVGVGTTAPLFKLDVSGSAHAISLIVDGNVGIGAPVPAALLHVGGNARVDGDLTLSGGSRLVRMAPIAYAYAPTQVIVNAAGGATTPGDLTVTIDVRAGELVRVTTSFTAIGDYYWEIVLFQGNATSLLLGLGVVQSPTFDGQHAQGLYRADATGPLTFRVRYSAQSLSGVGQKVWQTLIAEVVGSQ